MADAALFEFLHTEMVAELWARAPDPSPGGQKTSLSVLEGMGFRVGQALGERLPRETLAFREEQPPKEVPALGGRVLDCPLTLQIGDHWDQRGGAVGSCSRPPPHPQWYTALCPQGTYILQDNDFPLLVRMAAGPQYLEEAPKFLAFTCGLLRGTLSTLGIKSLVTASVTTLPACKFQVVIQRA
ncbi:trafficking protein particle complex subunit 6A [Echinops telfairi]|uniref:Trafficking protein particle complex subunit 6A n=1 Tax=Echinops telfairi TaxID=9371 RepID=A0AC55DA44_ECHTE|nr:trafficking protein particle complex subunit 6A [Echinops telfairi]